MKGGAGWTEVQGVSVCPQESGLSVWIGGQLHPLEHVPPVLAVLLITVVIAFFTEFASNTATIIIFLPVLAELVRIANPESPATELPWGCSCPARFQNARESLNHRASSQRTGASSLKEYLRSGVVPLWES